MSRLPVFSGREAVKAFERMGYAVDRQKGSHIHMRQVAAPHRRLTVPDHRALAPPAFHPRRAPGGYPA